MDIDIKNALALLEKPLKYLSDHWARRIARRDDLIEELWNLLLDTSIVGRHKKNNDEYRIVFSSTFYGHGQPTPGLKPSEIVSRIVVILRKYGWEIPQFVHILVQFKRHIESYKWIDDETLQIDDLNKFDEGNKKFVWNLQLFIQQEWARPSFIDKAINNVGRFAIIPLYISLIVWPIVLFLISRVTFWFLVHEYIQGIVIWVSIVYSMLLGCIASDFLQKGLRKGRS